MMGGMPNREGETEEGEGEGEGERLRQLPSTFDSVQRGGRVLNKPPDRCGRGGGGAVSGGNMDGFKGRL